MRKTIVIAGGTGFLGGYLVHFFQKQYSIVVLTRKESVAKNGVDYVHWDGKELGAWTNKLEGIEMLINLAGKPINCKFTEQNKAALLSSRIDSTNVLVAGIKQLKDPPKLFLNASAGAMYALKERPNTEEDVRCKNDFLSKMALQWEAAFFQEELPHTRRVAMRISLILGKKGGAYPLLKRLTKFYLGGSAGTGFQKMSWIHIEDVARAVGFILEQKKIRGPVNFSTATPVSNSHFMSQMRKSLQIPFGLPVPAIGLKAISNVIDIEPALVLNGVNFVPKKLLEKGFVFKHKELKSTLTNLK